MIKKLLSNTFLFSVFFLAFVFACKKDDEVIPEPDPTIVVIDTTNTELTSNLRLEKSVNMDSGYFGDEVIFEIKVINEGPSKAKEIVVKDQLPSGYKFLGFSSASPGLYDILSGEWQIPEIDSGSSISLNITVSLDSLGEYLNSAEIISSANSDPNSSPNNNIIAEDDQDTASVKLLLPKRVIEVTTYALIKAGDGLTMDAIGNLFAANYTTSKVFKISTNQTVSTFLTSQPGAAGMAFDDQGIMFLARYENADIVRISPSGNILNIFANGTGGTISLDFDSQGFLYTNNNFNNAFTKMDSNGNKNIIFTSTLHNSSLTLDDNDNVYISDYRSGIIRRYKPNTYTESVFTTLPIVDGGIGFIIYSQGYFFASAIRDNVIYMIDQNGNYELIAGVRGTAGASNGLGNVATFDKPNGMVTSPDGKTLFVAQQGAIGAIRKITGFTENE